ncbi:MAG: TolC family protein [Desulfonatronovibrionaceae bacterium]
MFLTVFFLCAPLAAETTAFAEEGAGEYDNSGNNTLEMNLVEAISIGLRYSRQIKTTYMDRVLEKFDLAERRRKFYPNITVEGELDIKTSRTDTDYKEQDATHEHTESRSASATPQVVQELPTGGEIIAKHTLSHAYDWSDDNTARGDAWTDEGEGSVKFTQPLLKGAGIDYNTASLKKTEMESQEAVLRIRDDISAEIVNIIGAYNSLWKAQKAFESDKKSLADARQQLKINKLLVENGRKPEGEILQAEANVARKELSYEQAVNNLDESRRDLLNTLGIKSDKEIMATEEYSFRPNVPDVDRCLKTARRKNTAIIAARHAVRKKKLDLMQAKRDKLWDLSFESSYTNTSHNDPDQEYNQGSWDVGLTLRIPLKFFGGVKYDYERPVLSSRIALDKARIQLKEAQSDLKTDVLNMVRNVRYMEKRVELARKSREIARKNYEMDELKLRLGRITNNNFTDSQDRLSEAKKTEREAIISYIEAVNSLDKYMGTMLDTYGIEFEESRPAMEKKYLQDKTWMID